MKKELTKTEIRKAQSEAKKVISNQFEATKVSNKITEGGYFTQFKLVIETNKQDFEQNRSLVNYKIKVVDFLIKKDSRFKSPLSFLGGLKLNEVYKLVNNGLKYNSTLIHELIERTYMELCYNNVNSMKVAEFVERGEKINALLVATKQQKSNISILNLLSFFGGAKKNEKFLNATSITVLTEFAPLTVYTNNLNLKVEKSDEKSKENHKAKFLQSVPFVSKESKIFESSIFETYTQLFEAIELVEKSQAYKCMNVDTLESFESKFFEFNEAQSRAILKQGKKQGKKQVETVQTVEILESIS